MSGISDHAFPPDAPQHRNGLTLVEVLFSLMILTTAVLSVVLLFPAGAKTLEQSRFQVYASLKAMEIADFISQSRKDWRENDLEIPDGAKVGGSIRLGTEAFDALHMPDIEQTLLRELGSAYPMPPQIARRLDSPGDQIQKVLDQGGLIFYCDPFVTRDGIRQAGRFGHMGAAVPELQKLIFAVTTPAQQNLLPNHPAMAWPYYELYPFPPQGRLRLPHWAWTAQAGVNVVDGKTYNYFWDGPVKTAGSGGSAYEGINWEWHAANSTGSLWTAPGVIDAWRNLCDYGYTPIWYKLSYTGGTTSHDPNQPVSGTSNANDARFPPKPGLPTHWRGRRIQEEVPTFFASVPPEVEAARIAISTQAPYDTVGGGYEFDKELTDRLPSLGMRRMYRQLALQLWNSLEAQNPVGLDPLVDDLSGVALDKLHPARVLALSHLAHAAMMVTGYRLPYLNNRNDYGPANDVNLDVAAAPGDDLHRTRVGGPVNQFAAHESEANSDGTLKPAFQATALDEAYAVRVHENMMAWIMRFSSHFPYDWNVPRPANRPTPWDRPLYAFDLFDPAGQPQRNPTAVVTVNSSGGWPSVSSTNAAESFYQVLSAEGYSGGQRYLGFERTMSGWSGNDDFVGDYGRNTAMRSGVVALTSNSGGRFWPTQHFDASERARVLTFWAVDWKSYADAETAPSAPMDANVWNPGGPYYLDNHLIPKDHPEAPLLWSNADRNSKNQGDSDSQRYQVYKSSVWNGQFGADRNANGVCDIGSVRTDTRMRASEVARFILYDTVSYQALRR